MTKSEARQRGCERKKGYDTIPQARKAAAYVWSQTGTNLKVYKCQHCGKYHLTHKLDFEPSKSGGHEGLFLSSPNFTGSCRGVMWDRNDPEVREQNKLKRKELNAKEMEAMRPPPPKLTKEAMVDNPCYAIDQERYISGKNRHKHKLIAKGKVNLCIRCGRPIEHLDTSRLCKECMGDC